MRIYLVNVGTNASDGFASPLFGDGRFEFVPIAEDNRLNVADGAVRYRDLRSHYDGSVDVLRYIPAARWDHACHNDPEFETLTYGDGVGRGGRAANLRHTAAGDALLFLARLERWTGGERARQFGFYLIGGFRVDAVYANITEPPVKEAAERIARNAHVIRAQCTGTWDGFWVFAGSNRSRRFERAVPVTRALCEAMFRDKNGASWQWPAVRSELSVIGSYTRACRCVLDTSVPEQARRAAALRAWIAENSGEHDAALLEEGPAE